AQERFLDQSFVRQGTIRRGLLAEDAHKGGQFALVQLLSRNFRNLEYAFSIERHRHCARRVEGLENGAAAPAVYLEPPCRRRDLHGRDIKERERALELQYCKSI